MMRLGAIVALVLVFSASVPASAQTLVSPKLLPVKPLLRVGVENVNAAFAQDSPTQTLEASRRPRERSCWFMTRATGELFARDENFTGVGMLAGGSVTAIIGLTRRNTN